MSGFTIVPPSDRCDTLEGGLPSTDKEAVMVVYVTYRVPVEVELEIETGEIINVHIMDESWGDRSASSTTSCCRSAAASRRSAEACRGG